MMSTGEHEPKRIRSPDIFVGWRGRARGCTLRGGSPFRTCLVPTPSRNEQSDYLLRVLDDTAGPAHLDSPVREHISKRDRIAGLETPLKYSCHRERMLAYDEPLLADPDRLACHASVSITPKNDDVRCHSSWEPYRPKCDISFVEGRDGSIDQDSVPGGEPTHGSRSKSLIVR